MAGIFLSDKKSIQIINFGEESDNHRNLYRGSVVKLRFVDTNDTYKTNYGRILVIRGKRSQAEYDEEKKVVAYMDVCLTKYILPYAIARFAEVTKSRKLILAARHEAEVSVLLFFFMLIVIGVFVLGINMGLF